MLLKLASVLIWSVLGAQLQDTTVQNDARPFCHCRVQSRVRRIVGGHNAGRGVFPYAVGLMRTATARDYYARPVCGGTLITDSHVVTAAHCVDSRDVNALLAHVGNYNYLETGERKLIKIKSIVIPDEYVKGKLYNDIALLELEEPVDLRGLGIRTAILPSVGLTLESGQTVTAYGWGALFYSTGGSGVQANVLQAVDMPVQSNEQCQTHYRNKMEIKDNMFCAGGVVDEGTCNGDSGSGVVIKEDEETVLCGVVSFGSNLCAAIAGQPGVFTRFTSWREWVISNTGSSQCKPCVAGTQ